MGVYNTNVKIDNFVIQDVKNFKLIEIQPILFLPG